MNNLHTAQPYFFKVGEAGRKRLEILNDICNPESMKFLLRKKLLKPGMRVLELGCGTGEMSVNIANCILPNGRVDAIDISKEQLKVVQALLQKEKISNVTLYEMSTMDLDKISDKYDLIYCRLLLMHLKDQEAALIKARNLLTENGCIVSEDSMADSFFCKPASKIFDKWMSSRVSLFKFDIHFGERAQHLYKQLGFKNVEVSVSQPLLVSPKQRSFLRAAFLEHREQLVGNGKEFATEDTAVAFEKELEKLESSSDRIGFMKMFQIFARK